VLPRGSHAGSAPSPHTGHKENKLRPSLRLKAAVTAVTAVVGLGACGSSSASGPTAAPDSQQVIRINLETQPNSLDPGQQTYDYEGLVGRNTFEPLLKPTTDGKGLTGAAASSYDTSSDGLTVTFHLRDNFYTDGVAVKAQDFVYAWKRILDPSLAAGYVDPFFDTIVKGADGYSNIDAKKDAAKIPAFLDGLGLSAPDDKTFVVKLQHPATWFLNVASLWVGAPIRKDVVDKYGSDKWATVPAQVVGNGKWMVSELVANDHITLVPNPNFKGDKPKLKKLVAYFISDTNTAFNKYKTGDIDIVRVALENTDVVKADAKLKNEYHSYTSLNTFWLNMNNKVAPFDNAKVRMAFAQAINRDELASKVSHGQYKSACTFVPQGMPGYNSEFCNIQKYDPTAAKKALDAAGASASDRQNLRMLVRDTTTNKTLGEYLQSTLQTNLGVKITIDLIDSKTVTKRIRKGDYQLYPTDGWGMDYAHPQDIMDIEMTGGCHGVQFECYSNKQYDDLVTKGDAAKDLNAALGFYKQAEKILLTDAPVATMYNRPEVVVVKPYVQGITATPLDEGIYLPGDFYSETIYISQH
jgi:oligopeptide transport system substrate-binding protein